MENQTLCFTGHRPKELFQMYDITQSPKAKLLARKLAEKTEDYIHTKGVTRFLSGGALGTDQIAFMVVDLLKKKYPHIQNVVAVPFKDQPVKWFDPKDQQRYRKMLQKADQVIYVDTLPAYQPKNMRPEQVGKYMEEKMQLRNEYMVDHSRYVLAVFNGKPSGTKKCMDYAKEQQKELETLRADQLFI